MSSTLAGSMPLLRESSPAVRDQTLTVRSQRILKKMGIRLELAGERRLSVDAHTGTLVVANHLSWVDILAMLAVEPVTIVGKREVRDWPLIGPIAERAGAIFLDREGLRALPEVVESLARTLRSGRTVLVFPEGTTWCSPPGGQFRRAVFQAALDAQAPVRPVTVEYTQYGEPSTASAFVGDDPLVASIRRTLRADDLHAKLTVHAPLEPVGTRAQLAALAQATVRSGATPARELVHV